MDFNTTNKIFSANGVCDNKHKLNTSPKKVPYEILKKIENGITIEELDEIGKEYDVYRYNTQITIHGLFDELTIDRIGGYKNMVQNKNLSIGIRWNAIDRDKRSKLFTLLSTTNGYHIQDDSKDFCIQLCDRFSYQTDEKTIMESLKEKKKIAERIDRSLFFGGLSVYAFPSVYGIYTMLELNIHAFYKKNFKKLYEQISGMTYEEGKKIYDQKLKEEEEEDRKREERWKKWDEERELKKIENKKRLEEFKNNEKLPKEWVEVKDYTPQSSDIIAVAIFDDNKKEPRWRVCAYKLTNCFFYQKEISMDKIELPNDWGKRTEKICLRKVTGYLYKGENKTKSIEPLSNGNITIEKYSEKSIVVRGDTKPIKDKLKSMGGRFNFKLKGGAGWIFPLSKLEELKNIA